ncbi:uncharacterized protein LOC135480676 [Liolophura sinensis]|uniref:uncharacterized protein LOC135480676 n=1 Tax=Liolophura sinensis TaxID=3198878 RepID=UPI00315801A6
MSYRRPLIILLLIACFWQLSKSQPFGGPSAFQLGEGKCDKGQVCPAGFECRTEVVTTISKFPECSDLRSEVMDRTVELKAATLRSTIENTTLSDFYTDDTWFLFQLSRLTRGPPSGRTESSAKSFISIFTSWIMGEVSGSPSTLNVEEIFILSDDLVLAFNLIEATSHGTGFGAVYELVLWRREEGVLKTAVQTLNFVPRPRPPPEK